VESGERALDTTAVYILYLEREQLDALRDILRRFKSRTTQEAILLEVTGSIEVELI